MATGSTSVKTSGKHKRVVLSIDDKLDVLRQINKDVSYTIIMEKFGIGRSAVSDIKKNEVRLIAFKRQATDMGMLKKAKAMNNNSKDTKLD